METARRVFALRRGLSRCFASGAGGGSDDPSGGGVPNPITSPSAWDAGGVEGRLRRKRGPPPLSPTGEPLRRVGFALAAPTDEELYLRAGVPGYGETSVPRRQSWAAAAAVPPPPLPPPPSAESAPKHDPPSRAAPPPAGAQVRVSTGLVPLGSMPSFLSAWRLLALPAYRGLEGCLGARLLLGEQRAEEGAGRVRGGSLQVVVALTEWRDGAALAGVGSSAAYVSAMGVLGSYFKGAPEVATFAAAEPADAFLG
jgi:hypothetical protein